MSIFDEILLYLALLPEFLYKKLGVNVSHLRAILTAKLTMDNRRVNSINQMRIKESEKAKNGKKQSNVGLFFGSLFMGLFPLFFSFVMIHDMTTQLTLFYSIFIILLSIFLITDFTSVLIDVKDNQIILPKPISDSTFVIARLLHIAIRISLIALPLSLPSVIAFAIIHPLWAFLPMIFMLMISCIVSILLINAVYLVILKITTPEKFQSIISYIQISFAVIMYGSYQLIPRIAPKMNLESLQIEHVSWIYYLPTFWYAKSCENISHLNFGGNSILLILLSILTPFVSVFLVVKYFAPSFNSKLGLINASAIETNTAKNAKSSSTDKLVKKIVFSEKLASIFTKAGAERAGFLFTWKMMGRSRDFKMKVYPAIGYAIVMFVMLFFNMKGSIDNLVQMTPKGRVVLLMAIYLCSFVLINALSRMPYSEKYRAAWIFATTPVNKPGELISGAVKAAILAFYIPIVVFLLISGFLIAGYSVLPNIILGCVNIMIISALIALLFIRALPFSESEDKLGKNFIRSILTLMIPGAIGYAHYYIFDRIWVVIAVAIFVTSISWVIFDSIKKLNWNKIK